MESLLNSLQQSIANHLAQYGENCTYWVGYSGGLDSHVLLSLCQELKKTIHFNFKAIHIHHGLSQNADVWAKHCLDVCADYDIECLLHKVKIDLQSGDSLEELARKQRYLALSSFLKTGDVLLTGHHQDDQAETLLLQLFRGSGLKGLAAMPKVKKFALGLQIRPLLDFSRADLESYAKSKNLVWINDESNEDNRFSRNFIRNDVLSLLKNRWPGIEKTLARSALHCAEAQYLLDDFAAQALIEVQGSEANTLSVSKLNQFSLEKQKCLLRYWIQEQKFILPNTKKIDSICQQVLTAARDRFSCVEWQGCELRRYADDLFLLSPLPPHDRQSFVWQAGQSLALPNNQVITYLGHEHISLTVKYRQGGEVVDIPGRGRLSLKKLFQAWRVLPWWRDRIPLIYSQNKIIAIGCYFIHADLKDMIRFNN